MSKHVELIDQLDAYWLFLQGHDYETCALAAGVSVRTVRAWAESGNWKKDAEWVRAMGRSLALADLFLTFHKIHHQPSPPRTTRDLAQRQQEDG